MAKQKKPQRLKARQPRGFADRNAADIRATDAMMAKIKAVYELYGFDPIETPFFEYTDALGKFLPDTDRPNEGVFSLQDDDEQWMSLRYDLTAPMARHFAQNINELQTPYRNYRAGWVFRNEKPGPGRFRQFMQFDADIVGAPNPSADAEMCMMMADTMEALGVSRGDYVVRVNDRRVLDGVMDALGVEEAAKRLGILRSIDKLDKFGIEGVRLLLGSGRKDESGDFTKGVGLNEADCSEICQLLDLQVQSQTPIGRLIEQRIGEISDKDISIHDENGNVKYGPFSRDTPACEIPGFQQIFFEKSKFWINSKFRDAFQSLTDMQEMFFAAGYGIEKILVDISCVRGLEYYTGAVYECELTFPITNDKGEEVVFGSVAGGGRYDGLVKRFTGQDVPATGFSIGVSRLMTALKNLGKLDDDEVLAPVIVCVMDRDADALAGYQKMVQELRLAGIRAEMYQGNPKQFGKQLQYADRRGSPIAIIQGSQEREAGQVQVKDLVEGLRLSQEITDNAEWRAARPAQQTVKRDELVASVQQILAQQADDRKAEAN